MQTPPLPCFTEPSHFFLMNCKQDTRKLYGHYAELEALLRSYNRDLGFNVFWTVNRTDGLGRKTENITHIRAWYAEYDRGMPVGGWRAPPSVVTESSRGRYHAYWLLEDAVPMNETTSHLYLGSLITLVRETGGDENARDLARVLRVPGFKNNTKNFEVVVKEQNEKRYKFVQLCELWPASADFKRETRQKTSVFTDENATLPPESTRIARYAKYLQSCQWPDAGHGQRNGWLFRMAAGGVRDFALDTELVAAALEAEASVRYPDDWDALRIEDVVRNASRSASAPLGRAYQQTQIVMDE